MEILAPSKNLESVKAAVAAGCDAVYFSSTSFGARTNASLEIKEIKEIIEYTKLRGVKSFMTFNTVIFNDELEDFFREIDLVYQFGVDAIIVQDIAVINLLKENYPDLEIHASTQMNIGNNDSVKLVSSLGGSRVVLPREMSLENIKNITSENEIDFEVFTHGSICVSVSGQCYDSTLLDQKSANRGRCSQYCRMPQFLMHSRKGQVNNIRYPLNIKDMNNIDYVSKYLDAGVDSFKIEGRLKSNDYVHEVTRAYKASKDNCSFDGDLKEVYNREFTNGFVMKEKSGDMVNPIIQNNNGIELGKIYKVERNDNKKLSYYLSKVYVETNKELNKLDNIRFINLHTLNQDGQVIEQFEKIDKNKYLIYSNCELEDDMKLFRTKNYELQKRVEERLKKEIKRIDVEVSIEVKDEKMYCTFMGEKFETGVVFQKPLKLATTKEDILKRIKKTKDTPIDINVIKFEYNEDMYCNLKDINEVKRLIVQKYTSVILERRKSKVITINQNKLESREKLNNNELYIEVKNQKQYDFVSEYLKERNKEAVIFINDIDEFEGYTTKNDFVVLPNVIEDDALNIIDKKITKYNNVVVSELGAFNKYKNQKNVIGNFNLNITNSITQEFFKDNGIKSGIISLEINSNKIKEFDEEFSIVNIYGRVPVMTMSYCPINENKASECGTCTKCRRNDYYFEDDYGREFPLMYDGNNKLALLSFKPISLVGKLEELNDLNKSKFHIRFTIEDNDEVTEVLDNYYGFNNYISFETNTGSFYKNTL